MHIPSEANPQLGVWGPPSSTVDWCEENYVVSPHVAEYWNTFSNLVFLVLVAIGLDSCRRCNSEWRFVVAYINLGLVGLGSMLFHGTLLYESQLLDELPMLYGMAAFLFCVFQMWPPERHSTILAISLISLSLLITMWYLSTRNFLIFALAFFCELMLAAITPIFYIRSLAPMHPKDATRLARTFAGTWLSFASAFALWIADNTMCESLREWRTHVGYPLRIASEFHACWHLLTAYAVYSGIVVFQHMRALILGRLDMDYVYYMGIPICVPKTKRD
ncbi:hypothetical protein SeMB42_g02363 [Synchytrium endobioticum]|uniref:Ceramidase n=1 Tax=Synchytrium endobioticum TaxID=286115 RepID=A0A507D7E3_9FUNG|nr:hypothetical protein SeLEV6574_g02696 [Synchytrium endobioticum]TPX50095.1 hypothetical protein SeMB42_g02363 [Synchytrium endobioticum]